MNDTQHPRHARRLLVAWLALLLLMATSLASAYLPLHGWNAAVGLASAAAKSAIVAALFMRLWRAPALWRLVAGVALATWLLLMGLSGVDYATRPQAPADVQPARQLSRR